MSDSGCSSAWRPASDSRTSTSFFSSSSLACGCVLARRWGLARSPWLWAGAVLAVALWVPNVLWQARHGWPQLELAAKIAEEEAAGNRIELLPLQFLLIGPLLAPLWLGGLWWLLRRPRLDRTDRSDSPMSCCSQPPC